MLAGDDEPGPLPVFTEEDERREKADLIPSEVIDAECDLRGLPVDNDANNGSGKGHSEVGSSSTSKSSMDQQLSMLLHELVALPGRDKAAYLQAVIRCPNQANSQSHQAAMLQREEYGAKRAAKRIARYWEERKLAFGEARAFLPMTLHGALGDDVASMLESRIYHVLADRDDAGRTILSCDLSRVDSTPIEIDEEARHLWYALECVSQQASSNTNGVVVVVNCPDKLASKISPSVALQRMMYVLDLFPFQVRSLHFARPNQCVLLKIIPAMKHAMGREMRQRLVIHQGTDEEIQASMAQFGLNWNTTRHTSNETFKAWIYQRLAHEYADSCVASSWKDTSIPKRKPKSLAPRRNSFDQPSTFATMTSDQEEQHIVSLASGSKFGRRGDERMTLALQAKIRNPKMTAYDALKIGGFEYPRQEKGMQATEIYDCDNISLQQRKNQLSRRIRQVKITLATMDDGTDSSRSRARKKKML